LVNMVTAWVDDKRREKRSANRTVLIIHEVRVAMFSKLIIHEVLE